MMPRGFAEDEIVAKMIDIIRFLRHPIDQGIAGTHHEGRVLGLVVSRAMDLPLAEFLEETLGAPVGMASDAARNTDLHDNALVHTCLNARLRDHARFAPWCCMVERAPDRRVVPAAGIDAALRATDAPRTDSGFTGSEAEIVEVLRTSARSLATD